MAPKKAENKSPLNKEKQLVKPVFKKKKGKKNYESYSLYVYKILKDVAPERKISQKTMLIMNSFIQDVIKRVAGEAGKLVQISKKTTMARREIQSALKLLLPGELEKHANSEGMKAITKFRNSQVTK